MNTILLYCTTAWLAADAGAAAVALDFNDAAAHNGRAMTHYRAIEFHETAVQPLEGDVPRGEDVLYGQLPVGPTPETALAVVWLPKADGGPVLWLDANGDSRMTLDERHVVSGKEIELLATITVQTDPDVRRVQRTLLFRRPILGAGLRYAVRGYAAGSLDFGEAEHSVLLVDGNADGLLDSVGPDRVWIDLDNDGRFDGLMEQFPLGKPIVKEGQVFVIRSDPLATAVCANLRRPGEGKLRITLANSQNVAKFSAEFISDLGELVAIDKLDHPVPVPHGQYRISWLKMQILDSDEQKWNYSFSRRKEKNVPVPISQETSVSLFGKLVMQVNLQLNQGIAKPSETFTIRPYVTTPDNVLYLSSCTIGEEDRFRSTEGSAEILLLSPDGEIINRGLSGFS